MADALMIAVEVERGDLAYQFRIDPAEWLAADVARQNEIAGDAARHALAALPERDPLDPARLP